MRPWVLAVMLALLPGVSFAQAAAVSGTGVVLRGLDKVDGDVVDMTLANGQSTDIGRLTVELRGCRYPQGAATAEAYAYLTIRDTPSSNIIFDGWMIASSPALNALEHPRYDVWVMRCTTD